MTENDSELCCPWLFYLALHFVSPSLVIFHNPLQPQPPQLDAFVVMLPPSPSHRQSCISWRLLIAVFVIPMLCMLSSLSESSSPKLIGPSGHDTERSELEPPVRITSWRNLVIWPTSSPFVKWPENLAEKELVGDRFHVRRRRSQIQNQLHRHLSEQDEWEEDDDDNMIMPFHLEDDDASPGLVPDRAETSSSKENAVNNAETTDDVAKNVEVKPDETRSDESSLRPPLPPPPPPRPSEDGNGQPNYDSDETSINAMDKNEDGVEKTQTIENANIPKPTPNGTKPSGKNAGNAENQQKPTVGDNDRPADTILDDILRGFSFATVFCMCMFCLHRTCWCICVKCGICPDERVLEARWRRLQLKNKRAYFNPRSPPLDPKGLGAWMAMKAKYDRYGGGGVWDSIAEDVERDMSEWEDRSAGAFSFDDDGIALVAWEDRGGEVAVVNRDDGSESTDMELEYGEGDELEDKSHDSRMFDAEDGGSGVNQEADKFFSASGPGNTTSATQRIAKKKASAPSGDATSTTSGESGVKNIPDNIDVIRGKQNEMSDDAFFDALEPPSGSSGDSLSLVNKFKSIESEPSPKDFVMEHLKRNHQNNIPIDQNGSNNAEGEDDLDENDDLDLLDTSIEADDRGYDEDADLLGLRSDSPPPLDLEEIEKTLVENMEKSKFI
ncbi:hypothetical protein ACHAXS_009105 [Conticribra weissflogii]